MHMWLCFVCYVPVKVAHCMFIIAHVCEQFLSCHICIFVLCIRVLEVTLCAWLDAGVKVLMATVKSFTVFFSFVCTSFHRT